MLAKYINCFKFLQKIALLTITSFLLFNLGHAQVAELGPVKDLFKIGGIKVQGIKKVEKEAILERIDSKSGMMLDNHLLRRDLVKIYEMKYFEFVEAHQQMIKKKNYLVFKVKERPIISKINIEGNSDVSYDDIVEQIKTKEYSILDISKVKKDVVALQKFYEEKGFYLASVDYKVKKIDKANIELTFTIKEFQKVRVKKVIFLGNLVFKDEQLKDIMETKEENVFSFMSGSGNFKEINFQRDLQRILEFYKIKGYLQVNVGGPQITVSEDKKWVFITIKVTEGPQFTVNKILFNGEMLFDETTLREKIVLKENKTYSEADLRMDIRTLTELYQDEGYAYANVLRTLKIVPVGNKVDVLYTFEKGNLAYYGNIDVKGNSRTRDKVIRRELLISEGQKFSGTNMRKSKENIVRLGHFEPNSVIFNTISRKGQEDVIDLEIIVKERHTGQISLGAGYATNRGMFLQASIQEKNFLGNGQNLFLTLNLADKDKKVDLGFVEPYLFDTKWLAGGDIFVTKNEQSNSYTYEKHGGDLKVGYPIFQYTRLFLTYKIEETRISGVNDPTIDASIENGVTSSITTTLQRDKRNNSFEPSAGYFIKLSNQYAGVLANITDSKKWSKTTFDGRYFYNLIGDLVLRTRIFAGKLDSVDSQPIPRTERFSLGGPRDLRGYNFDEIGPKKTIVDDDGTTRIYNKRGSFTSFGTLEFEHPLAREAGLKWVVFFDAGNVFDKYIGYEGDFKLYYDYGYGLRWFSPIGVLRFEIGYPLNKNVESSGHKFYFDIGQLF